MTQVGSDFINLVQILFFYFTEFNILGTDFIFSGTQRKLVQITLFQVKVLIITSKQFCTYPSIIIVFLKKIMTQSSSHAFPLNMGDTLYTGLAS